MTPSEIAELRERLQMSQSMFAQLVGVHALTVSKWERAELQGTPFQAALMRSFAKAVQKRPDIGEVAGQLLLDAGVPAALRALLNAADA